MTSTPCEKVQENKVFVDDELSNNSNDFKGGLIKNLSNYNLKKSLNNYYEPEIESLSNISNKYDLLAKNEVFRNSLQIVSKCPSNTSRGFENTFKILEKQIQSNKFTVLKKYYLNNLKKMNATNSNVEEINYSTFFKLELKALESINKILNEFNSNILKDLDDENSKCTNSNASKINLKTSKTVLHNSDGISSKKEEEFILDFSDDYPSDIAYHIARKLDGKQYLKIMNNTLSDKVLCGKRVSQMTRAYDDIEAVTRLLEEKEKDLELTVQIGKELLTQNNRLEIKIAELEQEIKSSSEDRAQLMHDLHKKNELISVLTNYADDNSGSETPTLSKSITLELLQKKITSLQDENKTLKLETSQLVQKTDEIEEQEKKLMEDITSQLTYANSNYDVLCFELERQKEENRMQHEQIISLTARLAEAEMRLHQITNENDEQLSLLSITKENQNLLASELAEFKQKYQEVLALLQEAQEYMRKNRKKQQPHAKGSYFHGLVGITPLDSLHSELLESSIYSENSLDSGIGIENVINCLGINSHQNMSINSQIIPMYKKVFETVQCAVKSGNYSDSMSQLNTISLSSSAGPKMSTMPYTGYNSNPAGSYHRPSSTYSISTYPSYESSSIGLKTMSCESLASQSDDGYPTQPSGVPGAPGAKDLEAALKRLTPAEVLARRAMLSHAPIGTYNYDEQNIPLTGISIGIHTPDSIMSTTSSRLSNISDLNISEKSKNTRNHSQNSISWRLPEKLQIIKPMEGSQTLGHWSRLATPTLSGLLDERPGVTIRGGKGLEDLGLQLYSLSDVEEDVDEVPPGKQFQDSGFTYTCTISHVMHPDDGIVNDLSFLSQSQLSSRMASTSTSRQPSCPQTPQAGLSRRSSCSTFSFNTGLASMLNERGIKAVTQSALNTPAGANFSPTITPCNSPEGSPTRSISPEPLFGLLSTGADLIRRKLIGDFESTTHQQSLRNNLQNKQQKIMLSRLEKRALRSLRLLEKVESIGLENIIASQPSAVSQLANGIASRSASPMAQLTSLKNLQAVNGMVDDLQFDRNQIRAVLNKGLSDDNFRSLNANFEETNSTKVNATDQQQSSFETISLIMSESKELNIENIDLQASLVQRNDIVDKVSCKDFNYKQIQRQKTRRNIKNGQRSDLGTVAYRVRPDLGKVEQRGNAGKHERLIPTGTLKNNENDIKNLSSTMANENTSQIPTSLSMTQAFVGSISSLFFGRKGGWL